MTTNGITLSHRLRQLKTAGLSGVNISLDTLQPAKFEFITRRRGLDKVLRGLRQAVDVGLDNVKASRRSPSVAIGSDLTSLQVNCVVMKGLNDDEVVDFVRLTEEMAVNVRFIEYMPFSGNRWNFKKFVAYRDMLAEIMGVWPQLVKLEDGKNDTTKVRGHIILPK